MIPFFGDETDDAEYIQLVSDISNGLLVQSKVAGVFTVKIRDWFGPKWLGFAGKVMGALGVHQRLTVSLPPFHPNRVLSQRFYSWHPEEGQYVKAWPPVHLHVYQESSRNLKRYLKNHVESGALIWFTSGSKDSGNGALMVYLRKQDTTAIFYIGMTRGKNGWSYRNEMVSDIELSTWQAIGQKERLKLEPILLQEQTPLFN